MIKGVIFDLDGTLLDTIADLACAANRVLESHGYPTHSIESFKEMVGDGIHILVYRMLPGDNWSEETIGNLVNEMKSVYQENWRNRTKPFECIPELLDALTKRNLLMAILSNKIESFTVEMTRALLPNWHFEPLWGASENRPKKPDPKAALAIADYWSVQPSECLFVGDSEPDINTAKNAGIASVAVSWGFRSRKILENEYPDYIIDSPVDLLDLL
jgi:phosphoglycolate phosphatase